MRGPLIRPERGRVRLASVMVDSEWTELNAGDTIFNISLNLGFVNTIWSSFYCKTNNLK